MDIAIINSLSIDELADPDPSVDEIRNHFGDRVGGKARRAGGRAVARERRDEAPGRARVDKGGRGEATLTAVGVRVIRAETLAYEGDQQVAVLISQHMIGNKKW
jgi:hypothetical protein